MLGQFAHTENLDAGLGDIVVVLDRAAADADGADKHTILIPRRRPCVERL